MWRTRQAQQRKGELGLRASVLLFALEDFANNCHDPKSGEFCGESGGGRTEHGLPAKEQGVLRGIADAGVRSRLTSLLHDRRAAEPLVTKDLSGLASANGGTMVGLGHKFKEASGVAGKVDRKVKEKGITASAAAEGIGDALRYTMNFPAGAYTAGMKASVLSLVRSGYKFDDLETNWQKGDAYNGINAVVRHPKYPGLKIELQFHTPESFHVKDALIHKYYEFVREMKGTRADRIQAVKTMRDLSDDIVFPPDVHPLPTEIAGVKVKNVYRAPEETLAVELPAWRSVFAGNPYHSSADGRFTGPGGEEGDVAPPGEAESGLGKDNPWKRYPGVPKNAEGLVNIFRGKYFGLSNVYKLDKPVVFEGEKYKTVEAAFQAAKTLDPVERRKIQSAKDGLTAKNLGKKVALRSDWDKVKVGIMEGLVKQKFDASPELRALLVGTGGDRLIEGPTRGMGWDPFWGAHPDGVSGSADGKYAPGKNELGKILTGLRSSYKKGGGGNVMASSWREVFAAGGGNPYHKPAGSSEGGQFTGRLSSSKPSGVKEAAAYVASDSGPQMTSALIGNKVVQATIDRQSAVPGFEHFGVMGDEPSGSDPRKVFGKISDQMAENIVASVDESYAISKAATELHSGWYPFAHKWIAGQAASIGVSETGMTAATAVLSPGADWADNVAWAKNVANKKKSDPVVPASWAQGHYFTRLAAYQVSKDKAEKAGKVWTGKEPTYNAGIVGKKLSELSDGDAAQAIRGRHDAEGGGKIGGVQQLGGAAGFGEKGKYTIPQSDSNLAKAVSVLRDSSAKNVDAQLGGANKVRSFFNNLRDPLNSSHEDVTVDTHAYGNANGLPWGISSPYIASGKSSVTSAPSTAATGVSGTYPIVAEAYRKATAAVNKKYGTHYLPNQVQSIAWEIHRARFPSEVRKPKLLAAISEVRTRQGRGELTSKNAELEIERLRIQYGAPSIEKIKTQFETDVKRGTGGA